MLTLDHYVQSNVWHHYERDIVGITTRSRILYFDALNVVACFGVVAMHFNGLTHAYSLSWDWRQAFFVDCLFYWAVPVFFMLSGATLIGYREKYSTKTFLLRRFKRVFIPFVVWSIIALIWKVQTGQMDAPIGPRSLFNLIFNTQIIDIYWFFIPLFSVYFCIPVLSMLRDNKRVLLYLIAIGVLFNIALPFLGDLCGISWNKDALIPLANGYLLYVILGYILHGYYLSKKQRALIYLAGIIGVLFRFMHTVYCSDASGALVQTTWGYQNLPCFLESIAVFVFARQVHWEKIFATEEQRRILAKLASCSFGIYLIHMIIFWYGLGITGLNGGDIEWRLIGPIVAYFACLLLVLALKKIPVLKQIVP